MSFQFSAPTNRYTTTIAELLAAGPRAQAEAAMTAAHAKARALELRGQGQANLIGAVGSTVGDLIRMPQQLQAQRQQQAQQAQAAQLQGLHIQQAQGELSDAASKRTQQQQQQHDEELSNLGYGLFKFGHDPDTVKRIAHEGLQRQLITPEDAQRWSVLSVEQPEAIVSEGAKLLAKSQNGRKLLEETVTNKPGDVVTSKLTGEVVRSVPEKVTPGQGQHVINGQLVGPDGKPIGDVIPPQVTPKVAGPGQVHDTPNGLVRIGEDNSITPLGVKGYHPPPTGGGTGALNPDGVEYAATLFRVTGKMPALGNGSADAKSAIINTAAAQAKELGQKPIVSIQKQAAYKADGAALTKMQGMSAAAESFETKALSQADIVADLSQKVGRTQWPLINQAIIAGKIDLLGDKDAQLLANAITTFTSEYAKIMEGSTGSAAGSSDAARSAAAKLISSKLNKGTLQGTLDLMKREMRLAIGGYDATIAHITERMGGAAPPPAASGAPIKVGGFTVVVKP